MELAGVPRTRKQPDRPVQRFWTPAKTPALSRKPRQIVAQFGIVCLDTVGLTFARCDFVFRFAGVDEVAVDGKAVTEIAQRFFAPVHYALQTLPIGRERDRKRKQATGRPVYEGHEITPFFFEPINVQSSSSSAVSTVAGCGGVVPCVCNAAL